MIQLVEDMGTWEADVLPLPEPQAPRPCTNNRMLLHCGGEVIERNALFDIETPRATDTWFPLPHRHLVEEVETQLTSAGFTLLGQTHAVSHDGHRYFGLLEVSPFGREPENGHGWVVGLRNSHDKTFPEAFKEINPHTAITRCEGLHGLFDGAVAFAA